MFMSFLQLIKRFLGCENQSKILFMPCKIWGMYFIGQSYLPCSGQCLIISG